MVSDILAASSPLPLVKSDEKKETFILLKYLFTT